MKITIEGETPAEVARLGNGQVIAKVSAYVIGYRQGVLVKGMGFQPPYPDMSAFGEEPAGIRAGLLALADGVLVQVMAGGLKR